MPAGGGGIKEEQEILLSPGAMGTMGGGGGGGGQGGGGGGGGAATGAGLTTSSVGDIDTVDETTFSEVGDVAADNPAVPLDRLATVEPLILIEAKIGKFVLQVDSKIHIFNRVDDNIYKLHTRYHKLNVKIVVLGEVRHQSFEALFLQANFLEVIKRRENNLVAAFNQTNSR
ncbi:Protein of unknown function [Cotesia congregata]|uniref:Uncharacterized protein n=1 Tax=Cotesia congregata TaxID=51543 RepID=A0A8J2HAK4_COTCN|nr:Protein of unknown function [Cotesia congregata]